MLLLFVDQYGVNVSWQAIKKNKFWHVEQQHLRPSCSFRPSFQEANTINCAKKSHNCINRTSDMRTPRGVRLRLPRPSIIGQSQHGMKSSLVDVSVNIIYYLNNSNVDCRSGRLAEGHAKNAIWCPLPLPAPPLPLARHTVPCSLL